MSAKHRRIEISAQGHIAANDARCIAARDFLGVPLSGLEEIKVYKIETAQGEIPAQIIADVFADPVLQNLHLAATDAVQTTQAPSFVVEVSFRAGVTDNPARSAETALDLCGLPAHVASSSLFMLYGDIQETDAHKVATELLANELIQKIDIWSFAAFTALPRFDDVTLPMVQLATPDRLFDTISLDIDDQALATLSLDRCLALTLPEMHHIRDHFKSPAVQQARKAAGLPADATDVELEVLAQSWSEHCKHKIFAGHIDYTGPDGKNRTIESLYKTFIKRATKDIQAQRGIDWLISVFTDNAGIVRFDDNIDLCIKAETHNSPSALDPYGGALTGILGVNRDILGAGLGARPIANTDVFCFAPPDMPTAAEATFMPQGPKSPRQMLHGVHKGVEDGGNKSGIPTVNGAFFFDRDYAGKPLVFVGTIGVMPHYLPDGRASAEKTVEAGDRIFMVGGAIGADGIHGATFSSLEMNENAPATAVQIGDPLTQKRMTDFLLEARDLGLYRAITDNGAGGLSSSVGEMATFSGGAEMDLALCPVKYPGLAPWELMVSESQERMTLAVPPEHAAAFKKLAEARDVMASDIGHFTNDGQLHVQYNKQTVGLMALDFIHDSLPPLQMKAVWETGKPRPTWSASTKLRDRRLPLPDKTRDMLLPLLAHPNITSKEKWVRAYDHEVQAATHQKPFCGVDATGPADAGVIWLHPHGGAEDGAVVIGCGLAPRLSLHDPYQMAQHAVDEALRNVVAAGGDPDMCCMLDNFCWPDPVTSAKNPDGAYKLGQLVRTCEGLYDICTAYGTPLVSGKDSMKNDFRGKDSRGLHIDISILPTLMVTAMAKSRIGLTVGSDFKQAGDAIYLLGAQNTGMAGSTLAHIFDMTEDAVPPCDAAANIALYRLIHKALQQKMLHSLHDISEGGLLVSVAESMIGGGLGATINLQETAALFNEASGRFIVSVSRDQQSTFENLFSNMPHQLLGHVAADDTLSLPAENISLSDINTAWKKGF